jgi:hypothetical protein
MAARRLSRMGAAEGATVPVKPATLAAIFARASPLNGYAPRLPWKPSLGHPARIWTRAARTPSVAIANENRLVVPDTLGTLIKLTSSASWTGPALLGANGLQPAGRVP